MLFEDEERFLVDVRTKGHLSLWVIRRLPPGLWRKTSALWGQETPLSPV